MTTVKKPVVEEPAGEADRTFSLSVPFESVALTRGAEKSMLIGINRGENFREDVTIKVSNLPQGVTLETVDPVIESSETDATLMLKAAADAALGDFTFEVKGHTASSRADFSKEVKVTVKPIAGEADKAFSLSVPFKSVTLTQAGQSHVDFLCFSKRKSPSSNKLRPPLSRFI